MSGRRLKSRPGRAIRLTKFTRAKSSHGRGGPAANELGRPPQFAVEPAEHVRFHGVAGYDGSTGVTTPLALEGAAGRATRSRPEVRQQHALLRAVRAARSLNGGDIRRRCRFKFGHDALLCAEVNSSGQKSRQHESNHGLFGVRGRGQKCSNRKISSAKSERIRVWRLRLRFKYRPFVLCGAANAITAGY